MSWQGLFLSLLLFSITQQSLSLLLSLSPLQDIQATVISPAA